MIQARPGWDEIVGEVPGPAVTSMKASNQREDQAASLAGLRVEIERRKDDLEDALSAGSKTAAALTGELWGLCDQYDRQSAPLADEPVV